MNLLLVAAGAAVGAPLRYLVDRFVMMRAAHAAPARTFPWGTLWVNVIGSFLLGVLTATPDRTTTLVLGVGFCGAFTTYSAFGADTSQLTAEGRRGAALLNIALNLGSGLSAALLGILLAGGVT